MAVTVLATVPLRTGYPGLRQACRRTLSITAPRALSPRGTVAFLASSAARSTRFAGAGAAGRAAQGVWCKRPVGAVHSENRGEDDGGTTQITALLVLSLMLLSLPWALEHPVVLLVPVVLSSLPGVGPGFIQPIFRQALTWVFACCRWLPRLATAGMFQQKEAQQPYRRRRTAAPPPPLVTPHPRHAPAGGMHRAPAPARHTSYSTNILDNLDQL